MFRKKGNKGAVYEDAVLMDEQYIKFAIDNCEKKVSESIKFDKNHELYSVPLCLIKDIDHNALKKSGKSSVNQLGIVIEILQKESPEEKDKKYLETNFPSQSLVQLLEEALEQSILKQHGKLFNSDMVTEIAKGTHVELLSRLSISILEAAKKQTKHKGILDQAIEFKNEEKDFRERKGSK